MKKLQGSIYKPSHLNTIYIKFKGRVIATGLKATKQNFLVAKQRLFQLNLQSQGLIKSTKQITFADGWEIYKLKLQTKHPQTQRLRNLIYRQLVTDPEQLVTKENVYKFANEIKKKPITKTTLNIYFRHFEVFLNYLYELELAPRIRLYKEFATKTITKQAKQYTDLELLKLYKYTYKHNREFCYLVMFMVATGSRVIDALTLTWEQINFQQQTIDFRNKITKQPELRPVSKTAIKILKRLKQTRTTCGKSHKPFRWQYTTASRLTNWLHKAFKATGIDANGRAFQEFRITFRMKLFQRGTPKDIIEYLLRHSPAKLIDNYYTDYKEYNQIVKNYLY